MSLAAQPFSEPGAPLLHPAPGFDEAFYTQTLSPFNFKGLRAIRRASLPLPLPIVPLRPILRAAPPILEAPDPFGFDIDALELDSSDLDDASAFDSPDDHSDHLEGLRLEEHSFRDSEAAKLGDVPKILRERWTERSRIDHYCQTCRCDIPAGDGAKCVTVSQFSKLSTLYYCYSCAIGDPNGNPNGQKCFEEQSEIQPNTSGGHAGSSTSAGGNR